MAKRMGKKTINKIHQLRGEGLSGAAIAKRVKRSLPTIYKVLSAGKAPDPVTSRSNGAKRVGGLSEIERIVQREVESRLKNAKYAAIKALTNSLKA
jgi:hypothetical protein